MMKKILLFILFLGVLSGSAQNNGQQVENKKTTEKTDTIPELNIEMVLIKGGSFEMGSPVAEAGRKKDEMLHKVTLDDFSIARTEVTQDLWMLIMGNNPSFIKGPKLPVENVSWDDIQIFISKLNQKTGKSYRLPTEAEWEYACRAQSGTPFNTGENITYLQANFNNGFIADTSIKCSCHKSGIHVNNDSLKDHHHNHKSLLSPKEKTTPASTYSPNAWGLFDMHGNVKEWCSDIYGSYAGCTDSNPQGNLKGMYRVIRGGSWNDNKFNCRSASRSYFHPQNKNRYIGFRLAISK